MSYNTYHIPLLNAYQRWLPCFKATELVALDKRTHPVRRQRWVTSRIAMKYLLLCKTEDQNAESTRPLKEESLQRYSVEQYHTIDLPHHRNSTSLIRSHTDQLPFYFSTTYHGYSAILVQSSDSSVTVDAESVMQHISEPFMKHHFTGQERYWCRHPPQGLCSGQAFTLIWTLKEALLKQLGTTKVTLWTFGTLNTIIENFEWESKTSCSFQGTVQIDRETICYSGHSKINSTEILTILTIKTQ